MVEWTKYYHVLLAEKAGIDFSYRPAGRIRRLDE